MAEILPIRRKTLFIQSINTSPGMLLGPGDFIFPAAVTWLKYCRYNVKLYPINLLFFYMLMALMMSAFYDRSQLIGIRTAKGCTCLSVPCISGSCFNTSLNVFICSSFVLGAFPSLSFTGLLLCLNFFVWFLMLSSRLWCSSAWLLPPFLMLFWTQIIFCLS